VHSDLTAHETQFLLRQAWRNTHSYTNFDAQQDERKGLLKR